MLARVMPAYKLSGELAAPPSKNYTTRYLLAAALADGESTVLNPAVNDDALAMRRCLVELGAEIAPVDGGLLIHGFSGRPRARARLDVGNAGAVLRFLLAIAALGEEITFGTGFLDSLGRRPNGDLLAALAALGIGVEDRDGCLPITVRGGGAQGGSLAISGRTSSQFTSALLFLAPLLPRGLELRIKDGLRSQAAVRTTLEVLAATGIKTSADWESLIFKVPGGQSYKPGCYTVNGDYPAAVAILAAAALLPAEVTITGLFHDCQGERGAVAALALMGAAVKQETDRVTINSRGLLRGIEMNGDPVIDAVLSLATVAGLAEGRSAFHHVGHLRFKESDRLSDFAREMAKAGLKMTPEGENLVVEGQPFRVPGGVTVSSCQDHRLVMALTAVGLRSEQGILIEGAEHVSKSYPSFFDDLAKLGARIELEGD